MSNPNLSEREREVLELIAGDSSSSVGELGRRLGVSPVSVRGHLNSLAEKGFIVRTWGGAFPSFHPEMLERQRLRMAEKNRIAKAAAALVRDGDTIMVEAGTTTALVLKYLFGRRDVFVVSNSSLVVPYARANPGIQLTLVGGSFRPATESLVGPLALEELDRFHVRLAFVGTDGFSLASGLTTHLVEGAEIVKRMAERAVETVLVADSSKYGRTGFVKVLPLARLARIISDAALDEKARDELKEIDIDIQLV
jgi:DeoR family transcriptional regulator, galactitol utilization operon repressor